MRKCFDQLLVAAAAAWMGPHRRDWALAMEAELEAAREDGQALLFAVGCLVAALRASLSDEHSRLVCAGRLLAVGVFVPVAALLVTAALFGSPLPTLADVDASRDLFRPRDVFPVDDGNRFALPALKMVVLLLAATHLRAAWAVLDRDWDRVMTSGLACAAATVTLAALAGLVFPGDPRALEQAAVLAWEGAALLMLARWHHSTAASAC